MQANLRLACFNGAMSKTLDLKLECDYQRIEARKETVLHLIATLRGARSDAEEPSPRAPISVVFVLDVSHSMSGAPLRAVGEATASLIGMLRAEDSAAVVTFSDQARVVFGLTPATDRTKRSMTQAVRGMAPQGCTNMYAGRELARELLSRQRGEHRQLVLLMSDGQPNRGPSTMHELGQLARSMQPRARVGTLGFSQAHDERILLGISEMGGGVYEFISDPALCHLQLAKALGRMSDSVADEIELEVRPSAGARALHTMGVDKISYGRGMVLGVPSLAEGAEHMVAMRLSVPGQEAGAATLAEVELRYRALGELITQTATLSVPAQKISPRFDRAALHKVLVLRAAEERKKGRDLADRGRFSEAAALLRSAARMLEDSPDFDAQSGSALAFAWDQLRDDADLFDQRPDAQAYRAFRRGQPLSQGGDFEARARLPEQALGRAMLEEAAGPLPSAQLVRLDNGDRFALRKPVNVIGRSRGCEVWVPSSKVSRQSAAVIAAGGTFWVEDLGSANGIWMAGAKVQKQALRHGDVFTIGDHDLRYEAL